MISDEQKKQELYRDARTTGEYDDIWQSVGKCVFCDLREKYVFYEENGVVMTISLYAYIDGNFMIIPRRHVRAAKDLTGLEWETIRKFIYIAKKIIRDVHGIKGVQFVLRDGGIVAQSTVSDHLHFHAIPFDAPDLLKWNYRKLNYTPLENVAHYKKDKKKILAYGAKYTERYRNPSSLPIVVDLVGINSRNEVMLQERREDMRLIPNYLTLPGGTVHDFKATLVDELDRELQEETGFVIDRAKVRLVDSRIGAINRRIVSRQLGVAYRQHDTFVWNTYVQHRIPAKVRLTPGDDCKEIVWVKLTDINKNPRISPELRTIIKQAEQLK